ncbi:MAG: hypothetical protein HQ477_06410 [Chloroflexi bacterium]|nr:hypothetical protein [Chloroflexota bacterium]
MKRVKLLAVALTAVVSVMAGPAIASASEQPAPFLCPVVGDGVNIADSHNGDNGVAAINPPVGTSFLPGNNQAGANANANALNSAGPGNPDAGPGGNPDFSPIWLG